MNYVHHVEFMVWADNQLLDAVPSDSSIVSVLDHVYRAEVVWMRRIRGEAAAVITSVACADSREDLRNLWPQVHADWLEWARSRTGTGTWDLCVPVQHTGKRYETPSWQIALHIVNHGTYHRGQATQLMRSSGIAPPPTDLIAFYRLQS